MALQHSWTGLWNSASVTGLSVAELAAPFDLVAVSLSKGLGAPGGSLLAGERDLIRRAVRYRRMLGGAMRQVGFFAAAGLYALDHNVERVAVDHANAKLIAQTMLQSKRIILDLTSVETNIIVFSLSDEAEDAPSLRAKARQRGVLLNALGARKVRALTHLDVSRTECQQAAEILLEIIEE